MKRISSYFELFVAALSVEIVLLIFDSLHCGSDIDECQNSPSPCAKNEKCTNLPGSHRCSCEDGYEQDTSTTGCHRVSHRVSQSKDIIIALCKYI